MGSQGEGWTSSLNTPDVNIVDGENGSKGTSQRKKQNQWLVLRSQAAYEGKEVELTFHWVGKTSQQGLFVS